MFGLSAIIKSAFSSVQFSRSVVSDSFRSDQIRSVAQSCPTPNDPMDCSLPGSSVHGILQARVLEWGAIASIFIMLYLHPSVQFSRSVMSNFL